MVKYFSLYIFFFISCSNQIILYNDGIEDQVKQIKIIKDYCFDTLFISQALSPNPVMSQIYDNQGQVEYYMWDHDTIFGIDYYSSKVLKKIILKNKCGKLNSCSGFKICSGDSIFVYNYWSGILFLLDSTSTVVKRWNILQHEKKYKYPLYPRTIGYSPIILYNDDVILSGSNYGHVFKAEGKDNPVSLRLNLRNGSISYIKSYPEHYRKANFGSEHCKLVYHASGEKNDCILYSFPMDHNIYYYSGKLDSIRAIYAGSKYVKNIKSADIPYSKMIKDRKVGVSYYVSESTYADIVYDKYRNFYYRIVEFPIKNWQINSRTFIKPFSILVLDHNFNVIGESEIINDKAYNRNNIHIVPEGLIIQKCNSDENIIIFSLFKFQNL